MPYASLKDVPENLKELDGAKLTLEQANAIAAHADGLEGTKGIEAPYAIAIASFKRSHKVKDGAWIAKEKSLDREVLEAVGKDVQGYALLLRRTGDLDESAVWDLHVMKMGTLEMSGVPTGKVQALQDVKFYDIEGKARYAAELDADTQWKCDDGTTVELVDRGTAEVLDGGPMILKGDLFDGAYKVEGDKLVLVPEEPPGWVITLKKMLDAIALRRSVVVWKGKDQKKWYLALVSKAVQDREGETVTTQGMDYSIDLSSRFGLKSGLYLMHKVPETRIGWAVREKRVGPFWIEVGRFAESPLANITFDKLAQDREGKYKLSIGFVAPKSQAKRGVYTRLLKYDTSVVDRPANVHTAIFTLGGKAMSGIDEVLKLLDPENEEQEKQYKAALSEMLSAVSKSEGVQRVDKADENVTLDERLEKALEDMDEKAAKAIKALFADAKKEWTVPPKKPEKKEEPEEEEEEVEAKGKELDLEPVVAELKRLGQQVDALTTQSKSYDDRLADLAEANVLAQALAKVVRDRPAEVSRPQGESIENEDDVEALMKQWGKQKQQAAHPLAGFAGAPGPDEGGL